MRSSQSLVPSFICGCDVVGVVAVKVIDTLFAVAIVVAKMALLEKKAGACPLDYPCHTFHLNIVATITMELVVIAHVDYYVVVPATVAAVVDVIAADVTVVVATDAGAAVNCAAADFGRPPFVSIVSIDSSIIVSVVVKVALTQFAVYIGVVKMALLEVSESLCLT